MDDRLTLAYALRQEAKEKLRESERLVAQVKAEVKTWSMPKPPGEPPMEVVRVRAADRRVGGNYWWHIRPGQWYPASRVADRLALASLRPRECDTWRHVLSTAEVLVDDTDEGERPLTELAL